MQIFTSHKVHLIDGLYNPDESNSGGNSKRPNLGSLWRLFQKKRSRKDKFGTRHLRNPLPSGHHQPNELQQIQSNTRRNTTHKSTPSQRPRGPRLRELSPGFEVLKFRVVYSPFLFTSHKVHLVDGWLPTLKINVGVLELFKKHVDSSVDS